MKHFAACLALVLSITSLASAAAPECQFGCHALECRQCCPKVGTETEKKKCWEVERKEICIPPVRFPWTRCGQLGCGRVRAISVLVRKEAGTVERCKYEWKVEGCAPCTTAEGAASVKVTPHPVPVPPVPAAADE